jgi:signal transduction histidine kinase
MLAFWNWAADPRTAQIVVWEVAGYAALGWRRAWPVTVYAVIFVQNLGAALLFTGFRPTLGLLIALFTVCVYGRRHWSYIALLATFVIDCFWVLQEIEFATVPVSNVILIGSVSYTLLNATVFSAGQWRRAQLAYLLESRRREMADAAAAVVAERNRIAAELHDVIAHAVTVIILQAAGARTADGDDPAMVDRALANIETSGQQVMTELRRLLLLVQSEEDQQNSVTAVYGPPPGLAEVKSLIAVMRSAGLRINFIETGSPVELATGVSLTAYRMIQEGLTNVAKHAGLGTEVEVRIAWHQMVVELAVVNSPPLSKYARLAALSTGHGLTNLRERARAASGVFEAGSTSDGGFAMRASLPLTRDAGDAFQPRLSTSGPEDGHAATVENQTDQTPSTGFLGGKWRRP